jgi:hypothetical protein
MVEVACRAGGGLDGALGELRLAGKFEVCLSFRVSLRFHENHSEDF